MGVSLTLILAGVVMTSTSSHHGESKLVSHEVRSLRSFFVEEGRVMANKADDAAKDNEDQKPADLTLAVAEKVLKTDGRPYFLLFGDSLTEYAWDPDLMG